MNRILVVSPNWLGDAVFSTPVYRALRDASPSAFIAALAVPRVGPVLALCPFIDEVISYDEEGADRPLLKKRALVSRLKEKKFDAVFILRHSLSRTFLLWLAGIPVRVGFGRGLSRRILTHIVDEGGLETLHRSDAYLRVVESFGCRVMDRRYGLDVPGTVRKQARDFLVARGLSSGEDYVVLNTGGNWDLKQWPEEHFSRLAVWFTRHEGLKVVLPGAKKDIERARRISRAVGEGAIVVAGETCLDRLAAIFQDARVVVSADSGPLHLASSVGAKVIALFGPTHPLITGPRGRGPAVVIHKDVGCNKAACYYLECPDNQCMKRIEVEDVILAYEKLES